MSQFEKSEVASKVLGCAITVHNAIGPGVFESVYDECLAYEFKRQGLEYERQVVVPVVYMDVKVECSFRVDFVVARELVVELKAVEQILPVHRCQVQTYLRLLNLRQGFILNFNVPLMRDGIVSVLNPAFRPGAAEGGGRSTENQK